MKLQKARFLLGCWFACFMGLTFLILFLMPRTTAHFPDPQGATARPRLAEGYGRLPLAFELNKGQTDSQVKFLSRGRGYALFLTGSEAVLSLRKASSCRPWSVISDQLQRSTDYGPRTTEALFALLIQNPKSLIENPAALASSSEPPAPSVVRLKLLGANPRAKVSGVDELPGKSNYFIGNDPKKWRTNVANYVKVKYEAIYPGIDLVYYGNQGRLEYDFVAAPGADPNAIRLELVGEGSALPRAAGGRPYQIAPNGDLVISTDAGEVRFHKPVVYQTVAPLYERRTFGNHRPPLQSNPKFQIQDRKFVDGRYTLLAHNQIAFELGPYEHTLPLIIDPVLVYSTYLGGTGEDNSYGIAVDSSGNAYVTGYTESSDFPAQNPLQGNNAGRSDAFVAKLSASGDGLVYSTYLGGSSDDRAYGIAVDSGGNAYVTGSTSSADFPTLNPIQATLGGSGDAFVTKLNAAGNALVYSTFLGGSPDSHHTGGDSGSGIAVDSSGNAYVTGETFSVDFPTMNPIQGTYAGGASDAFVSKLNTAGSGFVYSTYLGGSLGEYSPRIAVDSSGNAYITGITTSGDFPPVNALQAAHGGGDSDAFVVKLDAGGSALLYSTYIGGASEDRGYSIAVDGSGNAYITGETFSPNFPTMSPLQPANAGNPDAYVAKLNAEGSALVYSTYLGGINPDTASDIAVDSFGNAYVTGHTYSSNFPTVNPLQFAITGYPLAFVTKLDAAGSALVYSTFLGGSGIEFGHAIAVDSSGDAYITGETFSPNFLTMNPLQAFNAGGGDAFVAKLSLGPYAVFSPPSLDFGSQLVGTTSPGLTLTITNSGEDPLVIASIEAGGDFAVEAVGTTCSTTNPVGPGESCQIDITFTPTAVGARSGELTITDNAVSSPQTVSLTGTGRGPDVSVSPAHLDFGSQPVGTTSAAQTMTITNIGELPLTVTSIAASGDFDVAAASAPCSTGGELDPGLSCGMSVAFAPTETGTRTGAVTIVSNAPASPYSAALSGTGTDFAVAAQSGEATSASVAAGGTATYNLQLVPTGFSGEVALACAFQDSTPRGASCSVTPSAVSLNGADPAPFTVSVTTAAGAMISPFGDPRLHRGGRRAPLQGPGRHTGLPLRIRLALVLATLVMVAAKSRRIREPAAAGATKASPVRTPALQAAALAAVLVSVFIWAACGGGGPTPQQTGTLAGTYTLTVTATAGGLTQSTNLTLTVN